ncbi:hypothetical protein TorRG33x02_243240 [Trema orientale]|uniref:Uncharacterized protein n=1 Tax=Trema orientale TaxID=63057 RepID=A0A2P5DS70_TREOI|nr:hypothetical protein TorRG33x02_243240 [Trema orientale]
MYSSLRYLGFPPGKLKCAFFGSWSAGKFFLVEVETDLQIPLYGNLARSARVFNRTWNLLSRFYLCCFLNYRNFIWVL